MGKAMDCERIEELLPWWHNATLPAAERATVAAHLADCEGCRQAAAEVAAWVGLAAAHPAPELLVAEAEQRLDPAAGEALEVHLADCALCRADLARLAASFVALGTESIVPPPAALRPDGGRRLAWRRGEGAHRFQGFAAAAAVAGVALAGVALAGLWQERNRVTAVRAERDRLATQANELRRQRDDRAAAAGAAEQRAVAAEARLAVPRLDVPVIDLLPADLVLRGGGPAPPTVAVTRDGWLTLLLARPPGAPPQAPLGVELVDAAGAALWRGEGLRPTALGDYAVLVPGAILPAGGCELRLVGSDGVLARYRFVVAPAPPLADGAPGSPTSTNGAQ